jgi:hypothetical protein
MLRNREKVAFIRNVLNKSAFGVPATGDHGFHLFISFFDAWRPRCNLGFRFELQNSFFLNTK